MKLALLIIVCNIVLVCSRLLEHNHVHCNTKEGVYYCKHTKSCIPISDPCKNLWRSHTYFDSIFW